MYPANRTLHRTHIPARLWASMLLPCAVAVTVLTASCGRSESRQSDLPKRPDVWVDSIALDPDSKFRYIGKTKNYLITSVFAAKDLNSPGLISIGDSIAGIRVGAIRCSFFWRDASYGREQYMWRSRWGCQAGRSKGEIEDAVGPNGETRFDYLSISPVSLKD